MKTYIGTKVVRAESCTRDTLDRERGAAVIPNTENDKEGYKVQYEDGYTSWSPKEAFEKAYREVTEDQSIVHIQAVGFWGGFASRRKQERDEAIKLLRERVVLFREYKPIEYQQWTEKVEQFLKRFAHVQ